MNTYRISMGNGTKAVQATSHELALQSLYPSSRLVRVSSLRDKVSSVYTIGEGGHKCTYHVTLVSN